MAKQTLNIIKNWFKTGLKPTQQQFWDTWDSFWHKDAIIPSSNIENLDIRFNEKADAEALGSHIRDLTAHGLGQKAGLGDQNIFTAENTFTHQIRTPKVLTDTGIDFNLDPKNKVSAKGFAGKLTFGTEGGTLSYAGTTATQEASSEPSFTGPQFRISANGDTDIQGKLNAAGLSFDTTSNFRQYVKPATVVTTQDTQLFLPGLSGTLARTEDIPVITAGENVTITGTALNPVINASGGGSNSLVPVTYEELITLIQTEKLVAEQQYLLTDFQSTFVYATHKIQPTYESLYYGSEVYSGEVEPLIIKALANNRLSEKARSTVYENDEVFYTTENQKRGILASTKGTILRRTDKWLNNTANFDYRVTKYTTDGGEPKLALNLGGNCKINALGRYDMILPIIIGQMANSEISISYYNGTIMQSLYNSKLNLSYGGITSSNLRVYGCEINGALFNISRNYPEGEVYLSYIYANISDSFYKWISDDQVQEYLANKAYPSYVIHSGDTLYLQNNEVTGVTTTKIGRVQA